MASYLPNILLTARKRIGFSTTTAPVKKYAPPIRARFASFFPTLAPILGPSIKRISPSDVRPPSRIAPLIPEITTHKPTRPKVSLVKKYAPVAAVSAALLSAPAVCLAAGSSTVATALLAPFIDAIAIFGSMAPLVIPLGLLVTAKLLLGKIAEMKAENYQSPKSKLVALNPSLKMIAKHIVAPAFAVSLGVGAFIEYSHHLDPILTFLTSYITPYLPQWISANLSSVNFVLFAGLLLAKLVQITTLSIKDIKEEIMFRTKGIQQNQEQKKIIPKLLNNLYPHLAQVAELSLMCYVSNCFASQVAAMLLNAPHHALAAATVGAAALSMASYSLVFAGLNAAKYLIFGRRKQAINVGFKHTDSLLRATLCGAVSGIAVGVLGLESLISCLFVFTVTLGFAHSFIHSMRSLIDSIIMANKKRALHLVRQIAQHVDSEVNCDPRVLFKVSIEVVDTFTSGYLIALQTRGAQWIENMASGCFETGSYLLGQLIIRKLIMKDMAIIRKIVKEGWQAAARATTKDEVFEAAAATFDNLSYLYEDEIDEQGHYKHPAIHGGHPLCLGNLRTRSGGIDKLKDGTLNPGLPDSTQKRGDADLRAHGEFLRFLAKKFKENARRLRAMKETYKDATVESAKVYVKKILSNEFARSFPNPAMYPMRFYANVFPDSYISKQGLINECLMFMAHIKAWSDTVVLNRSGKVELLAIPNMVVREMRKDYKKVQSIDSRDELNEDLRYDWHVQSLQDVGKTRSPFFRCWDDTSHFAKYQRADDVTRLTYSPTAETSTGTPPLKMESQFDLFTQQWEQQEFRDLIYSNGARQRFFADGHDRMVAGQIPEGCPAILMTVGSQRHTFVKDQIQARPTGTPALLGISPNPVVAAGLREGVIPHPFGGTFEGDLAPRRLSMPPAPKFSISDADQVDIKVAILGLFFKLIDHCLRLIFRIPRNETVNWSEDMIENANDGFVAANWALSWMTSTMRLKDGRELIMPLNINKENEKTLIREFWQYIDQSIPARIVKEESRTYLQLAMPRAIGDSDTVQRIRSMQTSPADVKIVITEGVPYLQVPFPMEALDLVDSIESVMVDPIRFGEQEGPYPFVAFIFARKKFDGAITDRQRQISMSPHASDLLLEGLNNLLKEEQLIHMENVGDTKAREEHAWVDKNDIVHLRLPLTERDQILGAEKSQGWISTYYGSVQPRYENGELLLHIDHYRKFCREFFEEAFYRRYQLDDQYRQPILPEYTEHREAA